MSQSQFGFIQDPVLRQNIDETFLHIAHLISIADSGEYPAEAKSAFYKSIIIHAGSIIEALCFELLNTRFSDDDIKLYYSSWLLKPYHELQSVTETHKIVAGHYKFIPSKTNKTKLNLAQICEFLYLKGTITDNLYKKVTRVRNLRNEQHLSTQKKIKIYTRKDVQEVFTIAREIKEFVRKELSN